MATKSSQKGERARQIWCNNQVRGDGKEDGGYVRRSAHRRGNDAGMSYPRREGEMDRGRDRECSEAGRASGTDDGGQRTLWRKAKRRPRGYAKEYDGHWRAIGACNCAGNSYKCGQRCRWQGHSVCGKRINTVPEKPGPVCKGSYRSSEKAGKMAAVVGRAQDGAEGGYGA